MKQFSKILTAVILTTGISLFGATTIYEGFDYPAGAVGNTAKGGYGWNTVQHVNGPSDPSPDPRDIAAWGSFPCMFEWDTPPLVHQGVGGSGEQLFQAATLTPPANYGFTPTGGELYGNFNYVSSWREFDPSLYIDGDSGDPVYFSFLFSQDNIDSYASSYTNVIFIHGDPAQPPRTVFRVGIGTGISTAFISAAEVTPLATGDTVSPQTPYFMVCKITPNGASSTVQATLYDASNPADLIDVTETWEMSATIDMSGLVLDRIGMLSGGFEGSVDTELSQTRRSHFDELRFGPTWFDVTGVEESPNGSTPFDEYELVDGYVDTGDWMGWVYVEQYPWCWLVDLGKYVWVSDSGNWIYIPN